MLKNIDKKIQTRRRAIFIIDYLSTGFDIGFRFKSFGDVSFPNYVYGHLAFNKQALNCWIYSLVQIAG